MARKRSNPLTVRDVIVELGGISAVAALTQRGSTAVHNWLARGTFPASLHHMMVSRLKRRSMTAPPELWGQEAERLAA